MTSSFVKHERITASNMTAALNLHGCEAALRAHNTDRNWTPSYGTALTHVRTRTHTPGVWVTGCRTSPEARTVLRAGPAAQP